MADTKNLPCHQRQRRSNPITGTMKGGDSLIGTLRASLRRWATWNHQKDIRQRFQEIEDSKRTKMAGWLQDAKPYLRKCILAGPPRDGNGLAIMQQKLSTLQAAMTEPIKQERKILSSREAYNDLERTGWILACGEGSEIKDSRSHVR
ncbi:hypothetical protein LTR95_006217 [Oleoguttula sp. CCFEE 5521]